MEIRKWDTIYINLWKVLCKINMTGFFLSNEKKENLI